MGRSKGKKGAKKESSSTEADGGATAASNEAGSAAPKTFAVGPLLEQAQALLEQCEYATAAKFCQRAVDQAPTNVEALELLATISLELGERDRADECLTRCVQLSPSVGYTKYLMLAQIREGLDAIAVFEKAVAILAQEAGAAAADSEERAGLVRQLSSAYCAMVEIYLTDCCFEDDAEQRCETYLSEAQRWDPTNPEVFQSLASVRLSQQRPEDAIQSMARNVALWLPEPSAAMGEDAPEGDDEGADGEDFDTSQMPPYDFRINTVKLLLEVGQVETALRVIDTLMADDDEVVPVWYLCGWAYVLMDDHEAAREPLETALQLARKTGFDDQDVLDHIAELLQGKHASEEAMET